MAWTQNWLKLHAHVMIRMTMRPYLQMSAVAKLILTF
jgi:hypothetical protein